MTLSLVISLGLVTIATAYLDEIALGVFVEKLDSDFTRRLNGSIHSANQTGVKLLPVFQESGSSPDRFQLSLKVCKMLSSSSPAVLLSAAPCSTTDVIQRVVSSYHVPVLQWLHCHGNDWLESTREVSLVTRVNMSVSALEVILEVVLNEKWTDAVIIYDQSFGATHMSTFLQLLYSNNITTTILDVSDPENRHRQISRNYLRLKYNYIVFCSTDEVIEILDEVRWGHLVLLGPNYRWLIWDSDGADLDRYSRILQEGDNVAVLKPTVNNVDSLNDDTVLERMLSAVMDSVDDMIERGQWTVPKIHCNITHRSWEQGHAFARRIQKRLHYCNNCSHYEVLTFGPHTHFPSGSFQKVADWSPKNYLQVFYWIFPQLHQGFNNRTFLIASVPYPPFTIKYSNGSWAGICIELLDELAWQLNFSYVIIEPEDGKWGTLEDGKYSGLLGQIQRKEVDFGVGQLTVTYEREEVIDFTKPFWVDDHILLMKKPDITAMKAFLYLKPFSTIVWYLLMVAVPLAGLIIWATTWADPRRPAVRPKENIYDVRVNIWQSFGALMQQGMVYIAQNNSSRLMIALWWCFTIVVVGIYNGNLIAFLTAPSVDTPVDSLSDLLESKNKLIINNDGAIYDMLSKAQDGLFESVYDKVRGNEASYVVKNSEEALQRVLRNKNLVHLVEKSYFDTMNVKNNSLAGRQCDFVRSKQQFWPAMYAFPFQKDSPYRDLFSFHILRFLEAGLMTRWKNKWFSNSNRCTGLETLGTQSRITLAEAQGAFYLLGIGLLVAVVIIIFEKVVNCTFVKHCSGLDHMAFCPQWSNTTTSATVSPTSSQNQLGQPRHSRSMEVVPKEYWYINHGFRPDNPKPDSKRRPTGNKQCLGLSYKQTVDDSLPKKKAYSISGALVDFVPHATRIKLGQSVSLSLENGPVSNAKRKQSSRISREKSKFIRRRSSPHAVTANEDQPDAETGETTRYVQ